MSLPPPTHTPLVLMFVRADLWAIYWHGCGTIINPPTHKPLQLLTRRRTNHSVWCLWKPICGPD